MRVFLFICICLFQAVSFSKGEAAYVDALGRIGGYVPSFDKTKRFIRDWSPMYQLEMTMHWGDISEPIPWKAWINLCALTNGKSHTEIKRAQFYPASVGLSYTWQMICNTEIYAGAGVSYGWFRLTDEFNNKDRVYNKHGFGALLKSGVRGYFGMFFLEAFADYYIFNFVAHERPPGTLVPHRLCLNGGVFGGGMGFIF